MSRKYTLNDLLNWGHVRDYEAKKLIQYGFTDVYYEMRMSTIKNINKNNNYAFNTDKSRNGYMSYELVQLKPYKELSPTNKCNRSLWQLIKLYEEINKEGL